MPAAIDRTDAARPYLQVRSTAEWLDWLGRLADHARLCRSDVVDLALTSLAEQLGFAETPPSRIIKKG